jgi:lipid-A-disaccharide synthase
MTMRSCLISAAEPSGDAIAAGILSELYARRPDHLWTGCQGPHMRAVGVPDFDVKAQVSRLSAAGLVELIPRLPALFAARSGLQRALKSRPRVAIFVDAPDFHLPLAKRSRALGVPTIVVVPPQWWAWRPGRLELMHQYADLVLCLFEFEVAPLRARGIPAHWIGHPAATLLSEAPPPTDNEPVDLHITVMPGSRPAQVRRALGPMCNGVQAALQKTGKTARIEVPWRLRSSPPRIQGVSFVTESGCDVLKRSDLALVAAGTATLEAAALGVPSIITATAHPLTAAIARPLLRSEHLGLPNVLLKEEVVVELHQELHRDKIGAVLCPMLNELRAARQSADSIRERLRPVLGPPGFGRRAATFIEPLIAADA